jgi:hypothetical protein
MTMYTTADNEQFIKPKFSKKKIAELIYLKISSSLSDFDLSGKKFENKVKKVSKLLARDIARSYKKKEKLERETTDDIISV